MTKPKLVTVTDHQNNIIAKANAWRDAREVLEAVTEEFYEALHLGHTDGGMALSEIGELAELNKGSVSQMLKRRRLKGGGDA